MGKKKKNIFEWWMDRFKTITDPASLKGKSLPANELFYEASKILPKIESMLYSKGRWTAIKLAIISYYIDIYTLIARRYFSRICYVDTLAGSGLVKIKDEKNKYLYGSALLGMLVPREGKHFHHYIFIDKDTKKIEALKTLIHILDKKELIDGNSITLINEDMNKVCYDKILKKCSHSLIIVDPEGTEPNWNTISKLLRKNTDLYINFMTAGLRRISGDSERMNAFFGGQEWRQARNEEDLLELYVSKIENLGKLVTTIKVNGPKSFRYHLILAVRPTRSGNPWLKPIEYLKKRVETTSYEQLKRLLDVFFGKMTTLPL